MNSKYLVVTFLACMLSISAFAQKPKVSSKNPPIDLNKFVLVEGGTFKMGTDKVVEPHEGPVHDVTVKSFYIGKTEVTIEDYDKFTADTKRDTINSLGWGRGKNPAIYVSWNDAVAYCNWLSGKEKLSKYYVIDTTGKVTVRDTAKGYRLPTEAEWEFAARGGTKSKGTEYAGSDKLEEVGWFKDNSGQKAWPAGQKAPNELGLVDMNGNVWEWVWDWYGPYTADAQTNPKGAEKGQYRVMRGGAFYNTSNYARIATRQNSFVVFKQNSVGFRIARNYFQ